MKARIFKGKIEANQLIAPDVFRMRIIPELSEDFDFIPGQFLTITVAPMLKRSYSIASLPKEKYIDLIADTKIGGPGSQFFLKSKANDEVELLGPLGSFQYHESERDTMFWATGTGIVPFIPMLDALLKSCSVEKSVILNSGFRYENTILLHDWFTKLAASHSNFKYNLYLSRPDETWIGHKGRITELFKQNLEFAKFDHYLCGAKDMIDDVTSKLKELAVPDNQIYYEKY